MDKYEYNLKLEEIDKLVAQKDYVEAAKLADSIDWRRVRNVRTLCLISEIYEAAGRLEDSKIILLRAYKKSPVGRPVLFRLVEVTTELGQYDEAIEFYSEYVQVAPHDAGRYILKYNIYKGRGSQIGELIAILEEYLGQEYTERWAYELAKLYQQDGQMQKCFAACDDLVLWFRSGKYVKKALELKMRFTPLTQKQVEIYEECKAAEEELQEETPEETPAENVVPNVESTDGEVLAETIMAETEKEIADQVAAHKAVMEQAAAEVLPEAPEIEKTKVISEDKSETAPAAEPVEEIQNTRVLEKIEDQMIDEIPEKVPESAVPEEKAEEEEVPEDESAQEEIPEDQSEVDQQELQAELAKSMRKIISGVVKRSYEAEDDIPASVEPKIQNIQKLQIPQQTDPIANQLSIDDILLSMSDQGRSVANAVIEEEREEMERQKAEAEQRQEEMLIEEIPVQEPIRTVTEAAAEELTDIQREALSYTNHPERMLKNKNSLPTYTEEQPEAVEDLGQTRRVNTREELMEAVRREILEEKTIVIPVEEISDTAADAAAKTEEVPEIVPEIVPEEETEKMPEEKSSEVKIRVIPQPEPEPEMPEEEPEEQNYLRVPEHLRYLFTGFTEVSGLEDQIANAIIQAESKGKDRTSRTGNILIFGAHGSGKTTLAMNLAKAIAQDKGSQTMKVAKIYAADLNRKDIAATVAKIAGGTLIIEEAGDLEANTIEQLTTAMEFRTDGLILILEDEQQYIHEMLMQHPRFTMKFTAQIYIPEYTVDELVGFGQIYAKAQDYVIGEEACETLKQKISDTAAAGNPVSVSDVIDMVTKAIARSNKFFRKISMSKKRYDEHDYVILFPKDIK